MSELLQIDHSDPSVLVMTLNRPAVLNAMNVEMQAQLHDTLRRVDDDGATRVIVLTGSGERAFSAGYDIDELTAMSEEELDSIQRQREEWVTELFSYPLPIVVAINGLAVGMGTILAACADIRVGGPSTSFKVSATQYGGANLTWRLPFLIGWAHASDMLLTSRKVSAEDALAIGLLTRLVPDGQVLSAAKEIAAGIAVHPPHGIREVKRLVREAAGRSMQEALDAEDHVMRTTLRPGPMTTVFSNFSERKSPKDT